MTENRPILPPAEGTKPLDLMIAVMAFLAGLALGASLVADRVATSWQSGLTGKLTVQILPLAPGPASDGLKLETTAALAVLRATPGIARARALSAKEQANLVQPWLGEDEIAAELPLPQLIDADIVPGQSVDTAGLAERLKAVAPDASLDDHAGWMSRLRGLTGGVIWSAYVILFLIAVATVAAVSFATKARLDAHRDMVELLHMMGAQTAFIAHIFEWHYARAAGMAAAAGALAAAAVFFVIGSMDSIGIEAVPFLPPLGLAPVDLVVFVAIPLAAGLIGLATARLSVWTAVSKIY
jgi:cell division transport system permease protein